MHPDEACRALPLHSSTGSAILFCLLFPLQQTRHLSALFESTFAGSAEFASDRILKEVCPNSSVWTDGLYRALTVGFGSRSCRAGLCGRRSWTALCCYSGFQLALKWMKTAHCGPELQRSMWCLRSHVLKKGGSHKDTCEETWGRTWGHTEGGGRRWGRDVRLERGSRGAARSKEQGVKRVRCKERPQETSRPWLQPPAMATVSPKGVEGAEWKRVELGEE